MLIQTTRFGELEFDPNEIVFFPHGIPGFQNFKKYTIISLEESPFFYIQSVENGDLAFVSISPFEFYPEYEFQLPDHVERELEVKSIEEVRVFNIVSVKGNLEEATTNLVAPIVMNASNRKAVQVILENTGYSTRHALFHNEADQKEGS
ncbi:flagellar assembly protein FliW [Paenibacillus beijingensis]|uniref:Flagellar assembly factor FliW n=1 Tax=Paenibacillus beijingensis TaxID=1126833 RepID=A0A0D5NGJ5_9BACL|nr:flagellar assembly protein FliW [Paenibacillus beijingensis]AJY74514.1 hypothetical protein VN24_07920 [Paenibacillus beijingensis]